MLKGVLPLVSLAVLEDADAYGYEILRRLRGGGLDRVGDASVYGTLQRLYDDGLLSSYMVASDSGPSRKYFSITPDGRSVLKDGRDTWRGFAAAVTDLLDPPTGAN